jgi:hypothetical protein
MKRYCSHPAINTSRRCFKALGFDEYWESHGDGLQILRYNVSKAYNSHLDWIEDKVSAPLHFHFREFVSQTKIDSLFLHLLTDW